MADSPENPVAALFDRAAATYDRVGVDFFQPIDHGFALWKIYMNVDDAMDVHDRAVAAGYESTMVPERLDRWPVIVGFILDPDGYSIELIQRVDE